MSTTAKIATARAEWVTQQVASFDEGAIDRAIHRSIRSMGMTK